MNRTEDPAGSARPARDAAVIFTLGLAMTLYWLGTTHPQFNADSLQYYEAAKKLSGQPHEHFLSNRPPGYPLFMVHSTVPFRGRIIAHRWSRTISRISFAESARSKLV